jgi:hypothetical protein
MTKTLTKRDVIKSLYITFHNEIRPIVDVSSIFPDYQLMDLSDIVYLLSYYFGNITQYDVVIKELLILNKKQVDDTTFNLAYPIIKKFIDDFKKV